MRNNNDKGSQLCLKLRIHKLVQVELVIHAVNLHIMNMLMLSVYFQTDNAPETMV